MRVSQLTKLLPGTKVRNILTDTAGVVLAEALPSRTHGWRVQIETGHSTTPVYITPSNCKDWRLEGLRPLNLPREIK